MCGISGFIDFKKESSESVLKAMTDSLIHRGPDGFGCELFEENDFQIGLGHRRLSILELSELGKQPMSWMDYTIVFNGEIYNFQEIKKELIQLGHSFLSNSDTEMILHAYHEWGTECISRFIGMFSFVIYNKNTKQIFFVRDRAGVKPLFVYRTDDLLLFASELKAFHQHPRFKKEISTPAVYAFIQYGSVPTPHCIFENCEKLEPGHFALINLSEDSYYWSPTKYWSVFDAYNKEKLTLSVEEAKIETEKLLISACEYRMVSDVPVGVFLSGGYDSAAVTALLQKDRTERLKTFTIGVPDIGLNEAPFAKRTAEILGTDHTETECTSNEAIDLIKVLPFHYDEPFADSSAIPTMLVSKIAKKHVTVALSADAGDEVFGGYNRYELILKYGEKLKRIPNFGKKGMVGLMNVIPATKIPILKNKYNFAHRYEKVKSILANPSSENILISLSELFTDEQVKKLAISDFKKLKTYYDTAPLKNSTPLSYSMSMDYVTYLLDDILQKVDRASMAASLESREPFLDHRLIEFVAQLPDDFKIRNGEKKWLLKEIVHQYIPKSEMDRPKMGFAIPIETWLATDLKEEVNYHLSKERIEAEGFFKWNEIDKLKTAFFSGKKEFGVKIWYLLCFQMWLEKWR